MLSRWISALFAVLLCCAGGFLLLAILAGIAPHSLAPSLLTTPGRFLFNGFRWAAFYVPLYLFACAVLAALPDFRRDWLAVLTLTILPFLTGSLIVRLLAGSQSTPLTSLLSGLLGIKGSAIVLLLLLALELLLIYRLWLVLQSPDTIEEELEDPESATIEPEADLGFEATLDRAGAERPSATSDRTAPTADPLRLPVHGEGAGGRLERIVTSLGERRVSDEADAPEPVPSGSVPPDDREPESESESEVLEVPPPLGELQSARAFAALDAVEREWEADGPGGDSAPRGAAESDSRPGSIAPEGPLAVDSGFDPAEEGDDEPLIIYRNGIFTSDEEDLEELAPTDPEPEELVMWEEPIGDSPDAEPSATAATEPDRRPHAASAPAGRSSAAATAGTTATAARSPSPTGVVRTVRPPRYFVPLGELLNDYPDGEYWVIDDETEHAAQVLKKTLEEFNIQAEVTGIRKGPVITMFEILPAPGVKLSKIVNLADNIALRLAASRVRIVAPIPGKHAVGIEVPNKHRAIVSFKEMIASEEIEKGKMEIPVVLGKEITGGAQIVDLIQTPHLLIAGATGSGKSVCVNSIICSILYCRRPDEVKMILIDPKIVELKLYNDIPHLLTPVITESKKAFQALQYCIYEMERRYSLLDSMGVRDIRSYNRRVRDRKIATTVLPYIVVVIDEFADLMATTGKELESTLARLAAMSRAVGIHLVIATQRPSIDVITGLIKANIPSRIAFMVASKFDSRIIIDAVGAEMLLGRGDMLFTSAWDPVPVRIQGAYLSEEEVERVTDHVRTLGEPDYIDDEIFLDDGEEEFSLMNDDGTDPMYDAALDIVLAEGKASASYLQRRLKIGYNRAARIVEEFEERGIVGPQQGSKPREVIHVPDRVRSQE